MVTLLAAAELGAPAEAHELLDMEAVQLVLGYMLDTLYLYTTTEPFLVEVVVVVAVVLVDLFCVSVL
jgi:hypothetical protein